MSLRLPQAEGLDNMETLPGMERRWDILAARTQQEPFLGGPHIPVPGAPRGPTPQSVSGKRQLRGQHKGARVSSNTRLMSWKIIPAS